jgi:hypothetical protein
MTSSPCRQRRRWTRSCGRWACPPSTSRPTPTGRAGLYRSALAQITEPVLLIADNAGTEAEARPLLPGTGPHQVLVTSRHTLAGLGARVVDVTVLDQDTAIRLLDQALRAARPADTRITGDPEAAGRIAVACGGLPLALQIIASVLTADPTLSPGELANDIENEQDRLERLSYDDGTGPAAASVAAAFGLSYAKLDDGQARLFRLLTLHSSPQISTATASVLADLPVPATRQMLAALGRAQLAETYPRTGRRCHAPAGSLPEGPGRMSPMAARTG